MQNQKGVPKREGHEAKRKSEIHIEQFFLDKERGGG